MKQLNNTVVSGDTNHGGKMMVFTSVNYLQVIELFSIKN
jgi:hypothetical protein